jgi:hypothetical protein
MWPLYIRSNGQIRKSIPFSVKVAGYSAHRAMVVSRVMQNLCLTRGTGRLCGGGVRGHPSRVMPLRHLDLKTHMSEEACVGTDWHLYS